MKKSISLILVVVMLLSVLVGCGQKDEKKILGTWVTTVDITEEIMEEIANEVEGISYDSQLYANVEATFTEDGHVTLVFNMDKPEQLQELLLAAFDSMISEMDGIVGQGMTTEEVLEAAGIDLEKEVEDMLAEIEYTEDDTYTLSDGVILYGGGEAEQYSFSGDKLIIDQYTFTRK